MCGNKACDLLHKHSHTHKYTQRDAQTDTNMYTHKHVQTHTNLQVMSVDDDHINQSVVCSIFNSSGFDVSVSRVFDHQNVSCAPRLHDVPAVSHIHMFTHAGGCQAVKKRCSTQTHAYAHAHTQVLCFSGGEEALHHIATCTVLPDLVLLDCMMPGMDGFEVLRRLRGMSESKDLPVIMVSARVSFCCE